MNRREAVQSIALLLGGTIVGSSAFLSGCKTNTGNERVFSENDIAYLNEIADTILPATKTPGAKAANVGQFMTVMVNDCYDETQQKAFHDGMKKLQDEADKAYNKDFMELDQKQRHDLLVKLDSEQKEYNKLEKEIHNLEKKKEDIQKKFLEELTGEQIDQTSRDLQQVIDEIEQKTERWFELGDKMGTT